MSEQLALRSARVVVTRHWWVIRGANPWTPLVEGLFEPFLYLMSIGVGIGTLIGHEGRVIAGGYSYASFVAPALLATSAMNTAANQTIWGTWYRLQFEKFYDSLVTTPLTTTDIGVGEAWAATARGGLAGICFLGVIAALGMVHSLWAVAAIPAVVLIAFSFASAGLAVATIMRELHHNQYVQLVMLPMFLFSATFYPLSVYPTVVRDVVAVLPLYQSTVLARGLTLGRVGSDQVIAVAYLAVMGSGALWFACRRLGGLLAL
ncbi:MAG: ABC-type polysaccharide/polyol phosphate export system, permease component [Acidimicrobiaceae bacterium]|jgi:lipooligosaccharide transport system permease protein|nr:ABC-type polysaccharide/polyol phosphate export system, permease component [Acidimicrobiaceae bacterium]